MSEQALEPTIEFNETIHVVNEHGDPERTTGGEIRLKTNWKSLVKDRQGRTFNPKIHGEKEKLDSEGFLTVRRKEESKPPSSTNQSEAFVDKYREQGYAYRLVNDEGGRVQMFTQDDWEVVTDENGKAELPVGQAKMPNTKAVLVKKPIEWFEADQKAKTQRNLDRSQQATSPKEEGQYEADDKAGRPYVDSGGGSPLR